MKDWPLPKVTCIWSGWRVVCVTETILVCSEIKEVWAPELSVFEGGEVVRTARLYLLSITVLAAVTKAGLVLRSDKIARAGSGETARVGGGHKEAPCLRFVVPAYREDARLWEGFIIPWQKLSNHWAFCSTKKGSGKILILKYIICLMKWAKSSVDRNVLKL